MSDTHVRRFWVGVGVCLVLAGVAVPVWTEWEQREMLNTYAVRDLDDDPGREVVLFRSELARGLLSGPNWIEVLEPESGRILWQAEADEAEINARQILVRDDRLIVENVRHYRGVSAFDLSKRRVAWRVESPNQYDDVEHPVSRWWIAAGGDVLFRHRSPEGVETVAHNLSRGVEQWSFSDRTRSGGGGETAYHVTEERIYQFVKRYRRDSAEYDSTLRIIDADTGEYRTISTPEVTFTDRGVLMVESVKRSEIEALGGWSPSSERASPEETDDEPNDERAERSSETVRLLQRLPHDADDPEMVELDGRPIRLPDCDSWTAQDGRIVCLYDAIATGAPKEWEGHKLLGIPYRSGASGFVWDAPNRLERAAPPTWRRYRRVHPDTFHRFRHRHVLFEADRDEGMGFVLFDLKEGRPIWTSASFNGSIESARVSREGVLVMSFLPHAESEDEPFEPPIVVSFDMVEGRWLGAVRPIDTRTSDPLSMGDVQIYGSTFGGHLLVSRTPTTDAVWVLDTRRMELLYGPEMRLRHLDERWTEWFEDVPRE